MRDEKLIKPGCCTLHMVSYLAGISPRMALQLQTARNAGYSPVGWVWKGSKETVSNELHFVKTSTSAKVRALHLRSLGTILEMLEYLLRLWRPLLSAIKPGDIVQLTHPFLLFLVPSLRHEGVRIIYDVPEFYEVMFRHMGWRGKWLAWLVAYSERRFLPEVDRVVCVTSLDGWLRKYLRFLHGKDIVELWNLPSQKIVTRAVSVMLPDKLMGKKIVVYVGGMHEQKGARQFADIVKQVEQEISDVCFLIIGSIRVRMSANAWLEQQGIASCCLHIPWCSQEEMFGWLKHAHLGLVLSQPEGIHLLVGVGNGRKLFTYMAAGVPVVTPSFSQAWDLVSEKKIGLQVDSTSSHSVADAIVRLMGDEKTRSEMTEKAKCIFLKQYCWEQQEGKYFRVIASR